MLPLPDQPTNYIQLADWVELSACLSPDGNSSMGDLERSLHRLGVLESDADEDSTEVENKSLEVFAELEERSRAAGASYPFSLEGSVVRLRGNWRDFPPYMFCLCLSYFGDTPKHVPKLFPYRIFEDLACMAAGDYLMGHTLRFAYPRRSLPKNFKNAVNALCIKHLKEGDGFREQPMPPGNDRKLDVVAWREFLDMEPAKLLLFGQCAAGKNWEGKVSELQPNKFCEEWMLTVPVSPIVKALFVPHRIDRHLWTSSNRHGGIVFDRCRIAAAAYSNRSQYNSDPWNPEDSVTWINSVFEMVLSW